MSSGENPPCSNDNSNPQQGTGTSVTMKSTSKDLASPGSGIEHITVVDVKDTPTDEQIDAFPHTEHIRKLFVGGLPTDITEPEFRTFFEQFGELHDSVVMFDRETHRSRGFGFVTYVDPEVAKSLLRMGDHGDGVGRLIMRGKTCEVKAATPKGDGAGRVGRSSRVGGQNRDHRKNGLGAVGYSQIPGMFAYSEHVAYPAVMHESGTYPSNPQFQGYPGTAPAGAGVPAYMTPMYYHPSLQYPHAPPTLVMPPPDEYASTAGSITSPPFYSMAPSTLSAADFSVPASYPSAATAGPLNVPQFSQAVHPQHHHHPVPPIYSQPATCDLYPMVAMPTGDGAPVPPPGGAQSNSVMQPVAPGIPFKRQENSHGSDGATANQKQEVGATN